MSLYPTPLDKNNGSSLMNNLPHSQAFLISPKALQEPEPESQS